MAEEEVERWSEQEVMDDRRETVLVRTQHTTHNTRTHSTHKAWMRSRQTQFQHGWQRGSGSCTLSEEPLATDGFWEKES